MGKRKSILLFSDWFYPGFKAGGPIQSCLNFAAGMEDIFDIYVVTSNRDHSDTMAYPNIKFDTWLQFTGNTKVFYASSLSLQKIRKIVKSLCPDFIYLNSLFSVRFSIFVLTLKRMNLIASKIILAPRGMLKSSALNFKPLKKRLFLSAFSLFKLRELVTFHATDENEVSDIKSNIGPKSNIFLVSNFAGAQSSFKKPPEKAFGHLSLLFVGRIHPIKGLDTVLKSLKCVKESITFTIVAPLEDRIYWETCNSLINELPGNIIVNYRGELPHEQIVKIMLDSHLFILPTKGENFGHAIFEALAAGRPVLISDQTPWRNLAANKAGWDLPVSDYLQYAEKIAWVATMQSSEYLNWCEGAWSFCHNFLRGSPLKERYLKLFS